MRQSLAALFVVPFILSACNPPSQNRYDSPDIGHNAIIQFGVVLSERQVEITGQNTGAGAVGGTAAGAIAGSALGQGRGSLLMLVGGAIVGGIAGHIAEQALKDRQGVEYIVKFPATTQSIVQNIAKTDTPISKGECVMVQMNGSYQRVLPAQDDSECESITYRHHHDDSQD
jgi:outer membrane lipoprotein SlyB